MAGFVATWLARGVFFGRRSTEAIDAGKRG
jgi:hypothetical protein